MFFLLIKFYLATALSLFIPGHFFIKALFGTQKNQFSVLEWFLLSFGFSLIISNFLVIVLNFLSIKITGTTLFFSFTGFSFVLWLLSKKFGQKQAAITKNRLPLLNSLSTKQLGLLLGIIALSCLIRTFYLADGIIPQTTDLGHHIYWAKTVATTGQLPNYGMPDFIIGEHIIFAVIHLLSGFSFISAMPVAVLFLVNIFSLLAVFLSAYYLISQFTSGKIARNSAFFSLLIAGTFYATSSPQAKFIAGGVVGNLIGNLFIPLAIYLFILAVQNKDSRLATLFYLSLAGLGFTHHLSTFIFLYIFAGFLVFLALLAVFSYRFNLKKLINDTKPYLAVFLSKGNLLTLALILAFMFFVHLPSYLNKSAIDTAVGAPSKSTRVGLPLGAITLSVGGWKFFYALLGVITLGLITSKRFVAKASHLTILQLTASSLLFSWFFTIFLMSTRPALLKVDIISGRIVSYLTFPLAIFSAFFIAFVFQKLFKKTSPAIAQLLFLVVIGTGMISGFADISDSVRKNDPLKEREVMETYQASQYLNRVAKETENVLKDHIYLEGDTWMKLFFMRDYRYPLSRSYLRRYEDPTKQRETCTRDMIAIPHSEIGQSCFAQTKVSYVVLKKGFDTLQFEKSTGFSKIYVSSNVVIYQKFHEN